jgi:hypothetical protein
VLFDKLKTVSSPNKSIRSTVPVRDSPDHIELAGRHACGGGGRRAGDHLLPGVAAHAGRRLSASTSVEILLAGVNHLLSAHQTLQGAGARMMMILSSPGVLSTGRGGGREKGYQGMEGPSAGLCRPFYVIGWQIARGTRQPGGPHHPPIGEDESFKPNL